MPVCNGEDSNFMITSRPSVICKLLSDVLVRPEIHRIMTIFEIQQLFLSNCDEPETQVLSHIVMVDLWN